MSVSGRYRVLFNGNIIAADCCITRAIEKAAELRQKGIGYVDIINIRDKDGISSWPEKNSEEDIDLFLSLISTSSAQKEFFNNPVSEGSIFKNLVFGKVPPLNKFRFLVIYGDPAPGESRRKQASFKSVCLLGKLKGKLYVIKARVFRGKNEDFIEAFFEQYKHVGGKASVYAYVENNKLQDPFFKQVLKKHLNRLRKKHGIPLNIIPDEERKTDKATRIEANLEPMDRDGNLIFNEQEKDSSDMKELVDQFRMFELTLPYPADGPDCVEGGNRAIDRKTGNMEKPVIIERAAIRRLNKYRR